MMQQSWFVAITTIGPIGTLKGCGTIASLLTVPLVIVLHYAVPSLFFQTLFLGAFLIGALYCVYRAVDFFPGQHDPRAIVIDEIMGCLITFHGIHLNLSLVVFGFLLFRFFDIYKPLGISWLERWKAPWGIMADDIAAALVANLCMRLVLILNG